MLCDKREMRHKSMKKELSPCPSFFLVWVHKTHISVGLKSPACCVTDTGRALFYHRALHSAAVIWHLMLEMVKWACLSDCGVQSITLEFYICCKSPIVSLWLLCAVWRLKAVEPESFTVIPCRFITHFIKALTVDSLHTNQREDVVHGYYLDLLVVCRIIWNLNVLQLTVCKNKPRK